MIDVESETVISLRDACNWLPRLRGGKKPHLATLYRWSQRGINGVRLETLKIGGSAVTSTEALQRFFERCTNREGSIPGGLTERQRQRRDDRDEAELAAVGC